jgi:hypothetical protein
MSVTATFTRNSIAYKEDGTPVRAGVPRFEGGVMVEEGTTNLLKTINADEGTVETLALAAGTYTISNQGDDPRELVIVEASGQAVGRLFMGDSVTFALSAAQNVTVNKILLKEDFFVLPMFAVGDM